MYGVSTVLILPGWVTGPRAVPEPTSGITTSGLASARAPLEGRGGGWNAGWVHILGSSILRSMLFLDLVLSLVGMAAWSTTVAFLQLVLHQPASYNGCLVAATGLAGAVGTRLSARFTPCRSTYLTLLTIVTVSYLAVPHVHWLGGLVAVWLLRGLSIGVFVVLFSQAIARETPAEKMGRVQAAWEMSACLAAFLGSVATPWMLRHLGPVGSFYLFGSVTLSVTVAWALGGNRSATE